MKGGAEVFVAGLVASGWSQEDEPSRGVHGVGTGAFVQFVASVIPPCAITL